jgi:Holliday junction resolvase RusA-like endonuclease
VETVSPIVIVVAGEAAPFSKKVMSWKAKDGRFGTHAYDSAKYAGWKDQARYVAAKTMEGRPPLECPLEFLLRVYFQIPASWSNKKRELCRRGLIRPTVTPDADNLCKAAADSLTGIVIRDDKYIVNAIIQKWYSERPRVEIEIKEAVLFDTAEPELSLRPSTPTT